MSNASAFRLGPQPGQEWAARVTRLKRKRTKHRPKGHVICSVCPGEAREPRQTCQRSSHMRDDNPRVPKVPTVGMYRYLDSFHRMRTMPQNMGQNTSYVSIESHTLILTLAGATYSRPKQDNRKTKHQGTHCQPQLIYSSDPDADLIDPPHVGGFGEPSAPSAKVSLR